MKSQDIRRVVRDRVDGALRSANVPRPGPQAAQGSSLISLRKAHHRRGLEALRSIGQHDATRPRPRVSGGLRSEIKEEAARPGHIRGEGDPVASASPQTHELH